MCGIFGLLYSDRSPVPARLVQCAVNTIRHRGPDDEGYLFYDASLHHAFPRSGPDTDPRLNLPSLHSAPASSLAFGYRRLSILDLSPAGHQPMSTPDGRYWIVFNGEIYNYIELRDQLVKEGYAFRSTSDTEVLLSAYAHWGPAVLSRLVGMFAFCILDTHENRLFLARDFFGIKPLYYIYTQGRFAFASEIKALLELPGLPRRMNPQVTYTYLRYQVTDHSAETFFDGIYQLPPAHCMELDVNTTAAPKVTRYWQLQTDQFRRITMEDAAVELRRIFLENIHLHLRSDVPIGSCLSGGIDSSGIVMAVRETLGSSADLRAFSYIPDSEVISEERWIDLVGAASGALVNKVKPAASDLVHDLDRLICTHDEPFGSTSIYAQYRVFQLASENGIKVMQDGQGADELFGGYLPYISGRICSQLFHGQWPQAYRLYRSSQSLGISQRLILRRLLGFVMADEVRQTARRWMGRQSNFPWMNMDWFEQRRVSPFDFFHRKSAHVLRQDLEVSFTTSSLPMLLRYEDRNSMAFSIESRVPYLTPSLAGLLFSLPEELIIDNQGWTKAVFRRSLRGLVPDPILDRRDKIGFQTPEKNWLSTLRPWFDAELSSEVAHAIKALHLPGILAEWQAVQLGTRPFDYRFWQCINLIRWVNAYHVDPE